MTHTTLHRLRLIFALLGLLFQCAAPLALADESCGSETCGAGQHCNVDACVADEEDTSQAPSVDNKPMELTADRNLPLLQPLNDTTKQLKAKPDIGIFFDYFNLSWPWILGVAAGIGVLQALVGAIQVMISGSDSGMRENGKGKIMWALAGLLMIGLAGFILRSLNPIFFN